MTATAHALIGASIAAKVTNPILAIPIAIISHFVADFIPHWDAGTNHRQKTKSRLRLEATLDVVLGFAAAFLIFGRVVDPTYLFIMIIAAQLPDWIEAPSWMFGLNVPPFSWMNWASHNLQSRMQLPWGLITQIVTVGLMILFALGPSSVSNAVAFKI